MTVLSAQTICRLGLIDPILSPQKDSFGNSFGLSACGVDIRLAENVWIRNGEFLLASAIERFNLPPNIMGVVHDKSSLARVGLLVQNTVLEPGWRGHLTLELTYHAFGHRELRLPSGSAIAQVVFHFLDEPTKLPYNGKYQDQEAGPQPARST